MFYYYEPRQIAGQCANKAANDKRATYQYVQVHIFFKNSMIMNII